MKYLVVARHGEYYHPYQDDDHARICQRGQFSTEVLARALSRLLNGNTPQIYSSPETYACNSATIIGREFGITPATESALRVDVDYWLDEIDCAVSFVETCKDSGVETLILVAHYEYAVNLIPRIEMKWFGKAMEPHEVDYSHCTVLECTTGKVLSLP